MPVTLGSNIAALSAQRRLADNSTALSKVFERLSSGMRINRASDDAAGLSVSSLLNANARVFNQAIRNINDGISLTNIAAGAVNELSKITIRQQELAEQAANGTYSVTQRRAMNLEANALVSEFNRIVGVTKYNGIELLNPLTSDLQIQAGNGSAAAISLGLGDGIARTVGDGTFQAVQTYSMGASPRRVAVADLNNDGRPDIMTADANAATISVRLNNGTGGFGNRTTTSVGTFPTTPLTADLNGDGKLDFVAAAYSAAAIYVGLGVGDGTFTAVTSYVAGNQPQSSAVGDLNHDGKLDLVYTDTNDGTVSIRLGNGDGSFGTRQTYSVGTHLSGVNLADLNSDGNLDLLVTDEVGAKLFIRLGDSTGSFGAIRTYTGNFASPHDMAVADLDRDGVLDVVVDNYGASNNVTVFRGLGDGTLAAPTSYPLGNVPQGISLSDMNGDGLIDLVASNQSDGNVGVRLGNTDGTFGAMTTFAMGNGATGVVTADFNGDGVLDMATADFLDDAVAVRFGNPTFTATTPFLNLSSREGALDALRITRATLNRISTENSQLGAVMSRLEVAGRVAFSQRDNLLAAASRITDADIAQEAAELVRRQILQNAAAAVLTQANQQPAIALQLLKIGR